MTFVLEEQPRWPRTLLQLSLSWSWALSNSSSLKIPLQLLPKPVNLKIPAAPIQGLFPQHRALVCKQVWAAVGNHPSSVPWVSNLEQSLFPLNEEYYSVGPVITKLLNVSSRYDWLTHWAAS